MKSIVGIDISKATFDVFQTGGKERQFKNDPSGFKKLLAWAGEVDLFVMEATGDYHLALADFLFEQGRAVAVVNPHRSSYYARALGQTHKTDRADAKVLCLYAERNEVQMYVPAPPAQRRLKKLVRHRERLVGTATSLKRVLKEPALDAFEAKQCRAQVKFIEVQIKQVEREILTVITGDESLASNFALLLTVPGLGPITACTLLAESGGLSRFETAKSLASFSGLHPRLKQSGTSLSTHPHMSKSGSAALRRALYMSALTTIRYEGPCKNLFVRLVSKGHSRKSALAAAMHKQVRIAFGVVKSGRPFSLERTDLTRA